MKKLSFYDYAAGLTNGERKLIYETFGLFTDYSKKDFINKVNSLSKDEQNRLDSVCRKILNREAADNKNLELNSIVIIISLISFIILSFLFFKTHF